VEPNYDTTLEKAVAWVAEFVIAFVYGAIAGLMGASLSSAVTPRPPSSTTLCVQPSRHSHRQGRSVAEARIAQAP
jgi:hypothetical protein